MRAHIKRIDIEVLDLVNVMRVFQVNDKSTWKNRRNTGALGTFYKGHMKFSVAIHVISLISRII